MHDIDTSEVRVIVSVPSSDSNSFVDGLTQHQLTEIYEDKSLPLIYKAISDANEPGSIFKLITAYSLLQNSVVDQNTITYSNRCMYIGNTQFCEYGQLYYGWMNIERALYK